MANKKVTVRVTRNILHWALTQSSTQCAVARAIKDADDRLSYPRVTQSKIAFTDMETGTRYSFKTPPAIATFIDSFDSDPEHTKPVTFMLDLDKAEQVRPVKRTPIEQAIAQAERQRNRRVRVARAGGPTSFRPLRLT